MIIEEQDSSRIDLLEKKEPFKTILVMSSGPFFHK